MTKKENRKSIRTHILRVLFGVMLATSLSFGAASLWRISRLGQQATNANTKYGKEAIQVSKAALEVLSKDSLLQIAKDQGALCDARLERVRARNEALAAHAALLWRQPEAKADASGQLATPKTQISLHLTDAISSVVSRRERDFCEKMRPFLHWAQASDNYIESVQVATAGGAFIRDPDAKELDGDNDLGDLTPFPSTPNQAAVIPAGYDPRQEVWYRLAAKSGKSGWTSLYSSPFTKQLSVACYTPVYDANHKLVVVVTAVVSLEKLNKFILQSRLEGKGRAMLVDSDLDTISRDESGTKTNTEFSSEEFKLDSPSASQQRLVADVAARRTGLVEGNYAGKEHLVAYASVPSTNWTVLMLLPMADVVAPVQATEKALLAQTKVTEQEISTYVTRSFLILCCVFVVLVVLVATLEVRVTSRIVAPIQALDESAKILGEGNLEHRLEVHTGDELEDLADTFNQMATNLKSQMVQIAETTAAAERIQSELTVASEIQSALLPRIFPAFPHLREFDLYALMDPAKEVGGDFYDFFMVDETTLCFIIADVSDKGVPAALYMMVAKTMLKTEGLRGLPPDQILSRVNNLLAPNNDKCMFVTALCALLNVETGELRISNAGHNPPILFSATDVKFMSVPPGFVLGPMPDSPYKTEASFLAHGDSILFYTDGVTEAKNCESELFGNKRLIDCVSQCAGSDVSAIVNRVHNELQNFAQGTPQFDDITLLGLRFFGTGNIHGQDIEAALLDTNTPT